ncbi:hypothetical protein IPC1135_29650 [Pseudomonas aeruginosa]|uniref:hypothetical protein n=1 Tax=Pseudomonas aeruginosa TaxID=287 RepID=UPI000FC43142|nr:hypothetical protein [Pseudomonas aeruginosa]RUE86336.1 hypothetical protein IPC1135_29650 [Pseudomonas aeruginosa]
MDEVMEVLQEAKQLARRFYELTGKPLGVTGEVAEYEAATQLGLRLEVARQAGYDATELRDGRVVRIQIKGRCVTKPGRQAGRMGSIDLRQPFDSVLLVLLDAQFNAFAMYEASRQAVTDLITRPGSKARNERGSVGISQFKAISHVRWLRPAEEVVPSVNAGAAISLQAQP